MDLISLGWDSAWAETFGQHAHAGLAAARVTIRHNHLYTVVTEVAGECVELCAESAGKLKHVAKGRAELPAVGDWVAVQLPQGNGLALIRALLPRRSKFSRKAAGRGTEEQVVAANADTVLLIAGLDNDYSVRRIERYLVMAWESGSAPVVVLNKADLCPDGAARVAEVSDVAMGVPVLATSALRGDGVDQLAKYIGGGKTVALLGSSGVGKSTLINRMLGAEIMATQPVRERDQTGRHTTTSRQLIVLPTGGMVIDTPGMRELQLWDADEGVQMTFDEIETLAAGCRFSDCRHEHEPGCAVLNAVDPARLESFHKLRRELAWLDRKQDTNAGVVEKKRWKAIHKAQRGFSKR
jgi:ribosome biogenesis GTPase